MAKGIVSMVTAAIALGLLGLLPAEVAGNNAGKEDACVDSALDLITKVRGILNYLLCIRGDLSSAANFLIAGSSSARRCLQKTRHKIVEPVRFSVDPSLFTIVFTVAPPQGPRLSRVGCSFLDFSKEEHLG